MDSQVELMDIGTCPESCTLPQLPVADQPLCVTDNTLPIAEDEVYSTYTP